MGICDVFTAVATTENMSGLILLPLQSFVQQYVCPTADGVTLNNIG